MTQICDFFVSIRGVQYRPTVDIVINPDTGAVESRLLNMVARPSFIGTQIREAEIALRQSERATAKDKRKLRRAIWSLRRLHRYSSWLDKLRAGRL